MRNRIKKIDWRIAAIFAALILSFGVNSAQAQHTWARTYGGSQTDFARSVQTTSDGGSIVLGTTESFGMSNDIWLLKLDSSGNIQWQKTYGGNNTDNAASVQATLDGGYVLVGVTESFGMGNQDLWILRLDSSGNVLWQNTYGETGPEGGRSIQLTPDGGFIVAGYVSSIASSLDVWVLKLDAGGDIQWQKTYGGVDWDGAWSIQVTSDGGFILGGHTESFGAGANDFWVLKLDAAGNIQWQKTYGGASFDEGKSIRMTFDGGFIVAGETQSFGAGNDDFWVLKLDSAGNIQWQKTYGGPGVDGGSDALPIHSLSIQMTSDGGFIVGGKTESFGSGLADFWLLKLEAEGNLQWQRTYGGIASDFVSSVTTSGGRILIAGATKSFGAEGYDAWVLKLNASGDIDSTCLLSADTSISPSNSNAIVNDTVVTPIDSSVVPIASNAIIQDPNGVSQEQCASQCLFCDDFQDGVLASDWVYKSSNWSESNGALNVFDRKKASAIATPAFIGCTSCTVTSLMSISGGNQISLIGWHHDYNNFVEVILKEGSDKLLFKHKANGSLVAKQKVNMPIIPDQIYEVQVSFDRSSFKVSVDGLLVLEVPPGAVPFGTAGFKIKSGTGKFHEIFVE